MGILGAALAGFGGGAKGYEAAMERRDAERATAQEHQWDLDKEKRVEEATIRTENRGIINNNNERQAALDSSTDPNNVKRATDAKLEAQAAEDAYNNSQFPIKLDQAGKMAEATRAPDHFNSEGQLLDNQLKEEALALQEKGGKWTDDQKEAMKDIGIRRNYLRSAQVALGNEITPEQTKDFNDQNSLLNHEVDQIRNQYKPNASATDVMDLMPVSKDFDKYMTVATAQVNKYEEQAANPKYTASQQREFTKNAQFLKNEMASRVADNNAKEPPPPTPVAANASAPKTEPVPTEGIISKATALNRAGVPVDGEPQYSRGRGNFTRPAKKENTAEKEAIKNRQQLLQKGSPYR